MNAPTSSTPVLDLLIVGAGISGIGMAAHFSRRFPGKNFGLIERRQRMGGTWDLFRYPGIRSDSDMYTLGYGFAPWLGKRSVARGEQIREYLQRVAQDRRLEGHIRFNTSVKSANWSAADRYWSVQTLDGAGQQETIRARFLFLGTGYYDYDKPQRADIPGLENFSGQIIHPQFWPEHLDLAGKDIAVIGSGATAVTIVPAAAKQARHVTMVQRTPSWYFAQPGTDMVAQLLRRILPEGWAYGLVRAKNNALQYWFFKRARARGEDVGRFLLRRVRRELGDLFDPADFRPPYGPWEQRLCFIPDSDFFAAIRAGRASIATGRIDQVGENCITLESGRKVPADMIVTATGLRLAALGGIAISVEGKPIDPGKCWYYRSHMLSNVPNFAALFGYLNAAWTLRVELVAERLCRMFEQMDEWGTDVAVPHLPADHTLTEADPLAGFSSGYLERGQRLIPKSTAQSPWHLSQDYFADRREMHRAPIDDGILHFDRLPITPIR